MKQFIVISIQTGIILFPPKRLILFPAKRIICPPNRLIHSFSPMYSMLEHVVAPRGKSMNRKNVFENALKIFCRHSNDSIQTAKTFAEHICKLTACKSYSNYTCQFEWILNCDMIDLVRGGSGVKSDCG